MQRQDIPLPDNLRLLGWFLLIIPKRASLVAQLVKNLPAVQETWVQSLGQKIPLRRKWQPTPVFLPGEFHGQRNLVGYSPWGRKESDTTEVANTFTFRRL